MAHQLFALARAGLRPAARVMERSSLRGLHLPLRLATKKQHLLADLAVAWAQANLETAMGEPAD